jgi:hypothetical protein
VLLIEILPQLARELDQLLNKQQKPERREQTQAPELGIIYLVGDRLWIDDTPIARTTYVGNYDSVDARPEELRASL